MATTQILGIRNNLDAAKFLAYDFLNLGGNNNPALYQGLGKPGGKSISTGVSSLIDRGWRAYTDPITNTNISTASTGNWVNVSLMPSNLPASPVISQGYVYVLTNESGLTNKQNVVFRTGNKGNFSLAFGSWYSEPFADADYFPDVVGTPIITTNSMWLGDNPVRRALWEGANYNLPGSGFAFAGHIVIPGSVVAFTGAPTGRVNQIRWIPGTNFTSTYNEPPIFFEP